MKKKNVLVVLWSFSLGGGAEKILSTILRQLNQEKYRTDILEMEHFDKGFEPVPPGTNIRSFVRHDAPRWIRALAWRARFLFPQLIRRSLLKRKYDIEINFVTMNPPFAFSKRKDVLKIAWIHGSIEFMKSKPRMRKRQYRFLQQADYIVCISEKTKASVLNLFPDLKNKTRLIYNGYDFDELRKRADAPAPFHVPDRSICAIGRIEPLKGSDRVFDLIRMLHNRGEKYHLYFIGSGESETALKRKTASAGLSDYVHFPGYLTNPLPVLKQMSCLVSMSLMEGFPGVFAEALFLGIPFVTTDVGGAMELSGNGRFGDIIQTNEEAVACIIKRVKSKPPVDEMRQHIGTYTLKVQSDAVHKLFEQNNDNT